jgi:hypothetical protein
LNEEGSIGLIVADEDVPAVRAALTALAADHLVLGADGDPEPAQESDGEPRRPPRISVVPAALAKGLEYDQVVVAEPAAIVAAEPRGLRRLYVVLTRAVSSLVVVHAGRCRRSSRPECHFGCLMNQLSNSAPGRLSPRRPQGVVLSTYFARTVAPSPVRGTSCPVRRAPVVCKYGGSIRSARSGARWARRHPDVVCRRRSAPHGDPARSSSEERRMTLGDIGVPAQSDSSGGPELVQLLTPEGERVHHPDYPLEVTAEEVRDLYRDLVLVRRLDVEATALQRQGELGIWASLLGQEAAQIGSGRAMRPGDMAFPSYGARRGLVPWRSDRASC